MVLPAVALRRDARPGSELAALTLITSPRPALPMSKRPLAVVAAIIMAATISAFPGGRRVVSLPWAAVAARPSCEVPVGIRQRWDVAGEYVVALREPFRRDSVAKLLGSTLSDPQTTYYSDGVHGFWASLSPRDIARLRCHPAVLSLYFLPNFTAT